MASRFALHWLCGTWLPVLDIIFKWDIMDSWGSSVPTYQSWMEEQCLWHIDNLFDIYRHTLVIAVFACIYNTVLYKTIQNDCQVGAEQQCPLEETTTSIWRTPQWFTVVQLQTSYSQNTISFVRGIKKPSQALICCHRKGTEQRFLHIVVLPIRPRQVHCGWEKQ